MNRFLLALGCLALVACNSTPRPMITVDAGPGGTDAPGGGTDAPGGGTDAPMMRTDAPMMGGTCGSLAGATSPAPPLPAGCVPRCTTATGTQANTCLMAMDQMCLATALMSDTTPAANVDIGGGMTQAINCAACFSIQQLSCAYDACPSQTTTYVMCLGGGGMCTTEFNAINACLMADPMGAGMMFQTCAGSRIGMCFGAAGFAPDFARSHLESEDFENLDPTMYAEIARAWSAAHP